MKLIDALDMILEEHARSVQMYGTWGDYNLEQMMSVIINELMMEAGSAEARADLHGKHGVVHELAQVAACCIKAIMVLGDRPDGRLAATLRIADAHSKGEGHNLPASPSRHQGKESAANSPEGVTV